MLREKIAEELKIILAAVSPEAKKALNEFLEIFVINGDEVAKGIDLKKSAILTGLKWCDECDQHINSEWLRIGPVGRLIFRGYLKNFQHIAEIRSALCKEDLF